MPPLKVRPDHPTGASLRPLFWGKQAYYETWGNVGMHNRPNCSVWGSCVSPLLFALFSNLVQTGTTGPREFRLTSSSDTSPALVMRIFQLVERFACLMINTHLTIQPSIHAQDTLFQGYVINQLITSFKTCWQEFLNCGGPVAPSWTRFCAGANCDTRGILA